MPSQKQWPVATRRCGCNARFGLCNPRPVNIDFGEYWRGTWIENADYGKGQLVTHNGALWYSERENRDSEPSQSSEDWQLVVAPGTGFGGLTPEQVSALAKAHDQNSDSKFAEETQARQAADQSLADTIAAESSARSAADNALNAAISSEAQARSAADADRYTKAEAAELLAAEHNDTHITADYTVPDGIRVVWCDNTAGITVTLPLAASTPRRRICIKRRNTGAVTVIGPLDGLASLTIDNRWHSIDVQSAGDEWGIL